jgi:hypothetical protein
MLVCDRTWTHASHESTHVSLHFFSFAALFVLTVSSQLRIHWYDSFRYEGPADSIPHPSGAAVMDDEDDSGSTNACNARTSHRMFCSQTLVVAISSDGGDST